jgi:hypothetical protein
MTRKTKSTGKEAKSMVIVKRWLAWPLWLRVLGALLLGVLLGLTAPGFVSGISFIGDLFMRLIRMLVVPVVLISIASGVAAMADPRRLGAVGAHAGAVCADHHLRRLAGHGDRAGPTPWPRRQAGPACRLMHWARHPALASNCWPSCPPTFWSLWRRAICWRSFSSRCCSASQP